MSDNSYGISRFLPCLSWLRSYQVEYLQRDVVAGTTLAAYLIPVGIAYASLAGLPPQAGLYSCIFAGLGFAPFCTSRHTAIAVTSAISLLLATTLGKLADGDPLRYAVLASETALYVAIVCFVAWVAKAGAVIHFMSDTVLTGYKAGAALVIASTQLPKLLGLPVDGNNFFVRLASFLSQVPEANHASLLVGGCALVLLVLGAWRLPHRPVGLVVVVASVVFMSVSGVSDYGIKILGRVPQGLPHFQIPAVSPQDPHDLLPLALACFLLAIVETMAVSRVFAQKHRYTFDANQDLAAIGMANLLTAFGQGYPVSGGVSQSVVNESAGAKTPFSLVAASLILGVVTIFFSGLLHNLPEPVLAAIVLVAVAGLINIEALRRYYRLDKTEFFIAILVLFGVLGFGLLEGVLIGVICSLLILIRRTSHPHISVLGKLPGVKSFASLEHHAGSEEVPGVLALSVHGSLLYFNMEEVQGEIIELADKRGPSLKLVVCSLAVTPWVDLAATDMLSALRKEFASKGIIFTISEAHSNVHDTLRSAGVSSKLGGQNFELTTAQVVEDWQKEHSLY
ncbi:MAG TPA: SulP family inorganic anion transporter [Terriglobia bacterium]|nr:SulP family inorganic anion transporter [Terriglobia bacterium]